MMIFEMVVHAGGVKGLLLNMAGKKAKNHKQMDPNILRIIS